MGQTGISLNERFTQIQFRQQPAGATRGRGRRSRSQSRSRRIVDPATSSANIRLLQELKRKHTMQTALKLKRRSLRTTAGGPGGRVGVRAGGIRSLRVGPNGKTVRSSNVTRLATMRADLIANNGRSRQRSSSGGRRRSSSAVRGVNQRMGQRQPTVGGAAERVARRRRSLSRPWVQQQHQQQQPQLARGRSRSRSRARSQSRDRDLNRGRSQSRGREQQSLNAATRARAQSARRVSVKQRLGQRPGVATTGARKNAGRSTRGQRNGRDNSQVRGVAVGRIAKRQNSKVAQKAVQVAGVGGPGRRGRPRGRSAMRAATAVGAAPAAAQRSRSRSRARQGSNVVATSAAAARNAGQRGRRGRSAQRPGAGRVVKAGNRNGNNNQNNGIKGAGKQSQPQARRGRSRTRGGRLASGKPQRTEVKREDLDKELDQYMSTTKSEMDYLLK